MSKERIRKLAARLDRSVEEVVSVLAKLGENRYQRPDDQLPDAVAQRVERTLKTMPKRSTVKVTVQSERFSFHSAYDEVTHRPAVVPESIPEDASLNAALQDYLAAKPLQELKQKLKARDEKAKDDKAREGRGGSAGAAPGGKGAAGAAANTSSPVEDMLRDSLGAEIHKRRLLSEALDEARAELTQLKLALATRDTALEEANAARQAEQLTLVRQLASRLTEAETERDTLKAQLEQETRRLRQALSQAEQTLEDTRQTLAVLQAQLSTSQLALKRTEEQKLLLEQRLNAVSEGETPARDVERAGGGEGGREAAPLSPRSLFSAPQEEESTPGQRDDSVKEFLKTCQEYQIHRINIVGGSPRYQLELKNLFEPQLEVRAVDGTAALDTRRARQHVDGADLTLVWAGSILLHRVGNRYTDLKDPRVLLVSHRGIEGMLRQAIEGIRRIFVHLPDSSGAASPRDLG